VNARGLASRWLKFNAVGALGIVVQLGALAVLKGLLHVHYLAATALAVEAAVLHNFAWHEHWTWRDRAHGRDGLAGRLLRFQLGTGAVSIAMNLAAMRLLVGRWHVPYLAANLAAIAAGSLANYLLSDLLVFRATPSPARNTAAPARASRESRGASRNAPLPPGRAPSARGPG
jgi:putative flippase GtrA